MGKELRKIRRRSGKYNVEYVISWCRDPERTWTRAPSNDGLRAHDDPQVVSHRRALFGVDHAPPCIDKVLGADRGTIRPVRIMSQVEFVPRTGGIYGPRSSDPRHNASIPRFRRQTLIEIAQHLQRERVRCGARV